MSLRANAGISLLQGGQIRAIDKRLHPACSMVCRQCLIEPLPVFALLRPRRIGKTAFLMPPRVLGSLRGLHAVCETISTAYFGRFRRLQGGRFSSYPRLKEPLKSWTISKGEGTEPSRQSASRPPSFNARGQ